MGFEPTIRCYPYDDLANRCLQPLGHLSARPNAYKTHAVASNRRCESRESAQSGAVTRVPNQVTAAQRAGAFPVAVVALFPAQPRRHAAARSTTTGAMAGAMGSGFALSQSRAAR